MSTPLGRFVPLGILAFVVLLLLLFTSTIFRGGISRIAWYMTHLTAYTVLPLVIIHSIPIGMTLRETGLRTVWYGLTAAAIIVYLFRALFRLGLGTKIYRIASTEKETANVVDIQLTPRQRPLLPAVGQFIYMYRKGLKGARPYTVSDYETENHTLSITAKAQGVTSTELQSAQVGERLRLDGPYGTFGQTALQSGRPLVMIAGGIGITPFRRMIYRLEESRDREIYLFYGCNTPDDIVYKNDIDALTFVRVVYVIADGHVANARHGFITFDLIREYLSENPENYEYLLCGPPKMINKLEPDLRTGGVSPSHIHHELFTW